jgi:hypothetical protein
MSSTPTTGKRITGTTRKHERSRRNEWNRYMRIHKQMKWSSLISHCESLTKKNDAPIKESYRLSIFLKLITEARRRGFQSESKVPQLKDYQKALELRLLREPKKAPILTRQQLLDLATTTHKEMQIPLALILPTGARFADAARILAKDILGSQRPSVSIRIFRTKTIRSRRHQRYLSLTIPQPLWQPLQRQLAKCPRNDPLIQVSYDQFLRFLKQTCGPLTTTYSLRRGVFEQMRLQVSSLEEMTAVTFHRSTEQLRWYLESQLPDEQNTQLRVTAWHQE